MYFLCSELVCKDLTNDKEKKIKLEEEIRQEVKEYHKNKPEVKNALQFEMMSRICQILSDPIGQRRASVMQRIVDNSIENQRKSESEPYHNKCQRNCRCCQKGQSVKPNVLGKVNTKGCPSKNVTKNNLIFKYLSPQCSDLKNSCPYPP